VVQLTPHASGAPLQVAVPLAGTVHGVQDAVVVVVPHDSGFVFNAQAFPQR
jgi:hypothetical protein